MVDIVKELVVYFIKRTAINKKTLNARQNVRANSVKPTFCESVTCKLLVSIVL